MFNAMLTQPAFPAVDALIGVFPLPSAASARGNIVCVTPEVTLAASQRGR